MTNPRYANGNLRRKHRERLRAMGCECGICHGRFGPIHYDEPSDAQHPLSFVVDEIRQRTGRTCKQRTISAMRKKATKPGKTARKPAKKGQNRAAFRRSATASGRVGRVPFPPPSATPRCPAPIYTQEVF